MFAGRMCPSTNKVTFLCVLMLGSISTYGATLLCFCFPCRAQCNLSAGILRMRKSIRSCHVGFGQQFAAGAFRIYLQLILSRRRQKRSQDQDASTLTRAADANIPADDDGKMFRIVSRLRIEERHPRPPTASEKS